jgi:predicted RNA-binding Zn-ribbon protein involved in translation (DUF1610 family)
VPARDPPASGLANFAVSCQNEPVAGTGGVPDHAEHITELTMSCMHLKKLYDLCVEQDLKIGGTDLVRFVCKQCGEQEVCPTMLMEEYEAQHPEECDSGAERPLPRTEKP